MTRFGCRFRNLIQPAERLQVVTVWFVAVLTVPSSYGPFNSLTVIASVVAANQPCANVDSWSLPKSQRGVNPSEGVRPPGIPGCFLKVWTDFWFYVTDRLSFDSCFVIGCGLCRWYCIVIRAGTSMCCPVSEFVEL
jgi:hypothetical protein